MWRGKVDANYAGALEYDSGRSTRLAGGRTNPPAATGVGRLTTDMLTTSETVQMREKGSQGGARGAVEDAIFAGRDAARGARGLEEWCLLEAK